jgi:type II secretory pathway predicted ATPase ExeA
MMTSIHTMPSVSGTKRKWYIAVAANCSRDRSTSCGAFLENLPEPHILFDTQYRILAANAAYRRQFGAQRSVVGRTCYEVSHHYAVPCDQAGESCPLAQSLQSGQRERVLHLHHTPRGEVYVNIELSPLPGPQGESAYFVEKMEPLQVTGTQPEATALIGRSDAFRHMLALVARVAPSHANVLLQGESGTGKELVARAVHEASGRTAHALVAVDCASLPETLFESELFGHERGAFTGATHARDGLVEAASGGTLFIDEVGDIPLSMQVKLLRLLETGTYRRVGSSELRHADIRVVSATHRDLAAMVDEGRFREDLYYRLSTFPIALAPLRERTGDIGLLVPALLARVAAPRQLSVSPDALALLECQPYPAAHALAAAQHLHLVGADFGAVLLYAGLVGPFARAQAAFDIHLRALAQVLAHDFSQAAVEHHAVPFGGFAHFAALLVLPLVGGGDGDVGHLVATGEGAHFGVAAQVADDDDFVDGCHGVGPRCSSLRCTSLSRVVSPCLAAQITARRAHPTAARLKKAAPRSPIV